MRELLSTSSIKTIARWSDCSIRISPLRMRCSDTRYSEVMKICLRWSQRIFAIALLLQSATTGYETEWSDALESWHREFALAALPTHPHKSREMSRSDREPESWQGLGVTRDAILRKSAF